MCEPAGDRHTRSPLLKERRITELTLSCDIWVVDRCLELDHRCLPRVLCGQFDVDKEDSTGVGALLRAQDSAHPVVQVVLFRRG